MNQYSYMVGSQGPTGAHSDLFVNPKYWKPAEFSKTFKTIDRPINLDKIFIPAKYFMQWPKTNAYYSEEKDVFVSLARKFS